MAASKVKEKIKKLQDDLDHAIKEKDIAEKEKRAVQEALTEKDFEIEDVQRKLKLAQHENAKLEKELHSFRVEKQEGGAGDLALEVEDMKRKIQLAEMEKTKMEKQNKTLRARVEELEVELRELEEV